MASIRKRGDYSYEVQVRRKGFPTQTKTFTYRADAEKWARAVESEMDRGVFLPRSDSERITLQELIDRYLREVTPLKKNWKSESEILAKVRIRFGQYSLAALQSKDIAEYRDELVILGRAPSTVSHYLNALSGVISTAIKEWGYPLPANPCANVKKPRQRPGRDRRLLPGEFEQIIEECRRYRNPILEPLVRLAVETAMRQGELFALQWENVNLDKRVVLLRDTKNGDDRTVPLTSEAVRVLRGMLRPSEEVSALPRGRVFKANLAATRIAFTRAVERARAQYVAACERIGQVPDPRYFKDLVFHDLRHEATSRLYELGVFRDAEVAQITGHKTLSMLKRYTHFRAEELARKLP